MKNEKSRKDDFELIDTTKNAKQFYFIIEFTCREKITFSLNFIPLCNLLKFHSWIRWPALFGFYWCCIESYSMFKSVLVIRFLFNIHLLQHWILC